MTQTRRPSYVALVAALRAEFNDLQLEALGIQTASFRTSRTSIGVLAQTVRDTHDITYDTVRVDMGWVDPLTGLTSGPVVRPEYPLRCQHCAEDIRGLNGFYEDRRGFVRCRKDVDHKPMPDGAR